MMNRADGAVIETRVEITLRSENILLLAHSTSNAKQVRVIILKCKKSRISILMVIKIVVNVINIRTLLAKISLIYSSIKIKSLLAWYYIGSVSACLRAIC